MTAVFLGARIDIHDVMICGIFEQLYESILPVTRLGTGKSHSTNYKVFDFTYTVQRVVYLFNTLVVTVVFGSITNTEQVVLNKEVGKF